MKQEEMERILFGNSEFADVAFQAPMRLWQVRTQQFHTTNPRY
jgi:hypothetical protein